MNPNSIYETAKSLVMRLLRSEETITSQLITKSIQQILKIFPDSDIDEVQMFRDISALTNVWQEDASVIRNKKHKDWLPARRGEIQWNFWKRYRQYLEEEKGWSDKVIARLDSTTDRVLGDIGNTEEDGSWDRRGMVVGDVQSGKTANYTGLICKAVDAGYKLIIVLAGMTNDLRSQTQTRLDLEFLGYDSEIGGQYGRIGVGRYTEHGGVIAHSLTDKTAKGDFRTKKAANVQIGSDPLLLVVKKNKTPLELIHKWIESQGRKNPQTGEIMLDGVPLLIIDDEADNASVNTKKPEEDPATINRCIRKLLNSFQKSSYVGYTATPFANIFILPDTEDKSKYGPDLFPKDFIYSISPPSNYVGAVQIFGLPDEMDSDPNDQEEGLPLIRPTEDAADFFPPKHKKDLIVTALPHSMLDAVKCFILTCAARRVRGQKQVHNSMLIHVTRYNDVQGKIIELVDTEVRTMRQMLETRTGPQWKAFIQQMENLWKRDFVPTTEKVIKKTDDQRITPISWETVQTEMLEAISKIDVRGINGDAGGVLDYGKRTAGLNVIAIGGDKLSRGLTLEDLSISYYTRPATNYDTLLQMGRWFGYRPGYLDLCRLYTTEELEGWYKHIALASEELKREFKLMELNPGVTPEDYGLKVRTHPDGLSITAANKIRNGTNLLVSFSGYLCQTIAFSKSVKIQSDNLRNTEKWISSLPDKHTKHGSSLIWNGVPASQVQKFLQGFNTHPASRKADTKLLGSYIEKLNSYGELTEWTVALMSNIIKSQTVYEIAGFQIVPIQRTDTMKKPDVYLARNSNILNPPDQYIDLDDAQRARALQKTIVAWEQGKIKTDEKPTTPSGLYTREERSVKSGLLLLYPLDPHHKDGKSKIIENYDKPIMGFAICFPKGTRNEAIEYKVNTTFWQEHFGVEEDEAYD